MTCTADKDGYVKMASMYFFNIFVLVIQCFDINLFYMELTVDNIDGTKPRSVTDLKIFCSYRSICYELHIRTLQIRVFN